MSNLDFDITSINKSQCKFKHLRTFKQIFPDKKIKYYTEIKKTGDLNNKDGITICSYIDKQNNVIYVGLAFCNETDNYNKKIGSDISYQNMLEKPLIFSLPNIYEQSELNFIYNYKFISKYIKNIINNYLEYNKKFKHHKIFY
jgi:hypothetical protein